MTIIGSTKSSSEVYTFFMISALGWKSEMSVINSYGAEDTYQRTKTMSHDEFAALPMKGNVIENGKLVDTCQIHEQFMDSPWNDPQEEGFIG